MFKTNLFRTVLSLSLAVILTTGCRKRDVAEITDNLVYFEYAAQGLEESSSNITIKLKLVRATDKDIPVVINLTETGLAYGTDYTTTPAATGGKLNITLPSGNNEASFKITKVPGALFDGDEKLVFDLYSSGSPVLIGATKQLVLTFKELVAQTANMVGNGGGATYGNKVFFDLSANRQTPVLRTNWDLGFYTGSDDFRVILNSSTAMTAKQINKNDLTTVTAADTVGFGNDNIFSGANIAGLANIDYPDGVLTKTAIASTAVTATDNKVYIINRGTGVGSPAPGRGWKKVRIIRNASGGYTLQHADIAATTFSSIDIPKDDSYFFKYISFETGAVSVEPLKKKWDITWTYFTNTFVVGPATEVPYLFQDIILINRNVQIAKVMTTAKAFADFGEADIAAQTFFTTQNAFAADWRSGGGPTTAPAVRTDRYYIIKDGENNYYKVRFTGLTQGGDRGYPAFESVLVKRG